jgi:DNA-binding MarR family transcriptional regulator
MSKTDMIASMFSANPLSILTPKEISVKLGMDIRIVTSIVNRLKDEGSVERVGWGRYRLMSGMVLDEAAIRSITEDMLAMSSEVLGRIEEDRSAQGSDLMSRMHGVYTKLRRIGGEPFAINILRVCAKKRMDDEGVRVLVRMVSEGV